MENPPKEEKLKILDLAKKLEGSEDEDYIRENLPVFFEEIEKTLNVNITSDINSLYAKMAEQKCLARIESISRVIETLGEGTSLKMGEGDTHYANAVIPEADGIALAFSEGQANGPMRLMIGFGKTLIGFKSDHIQVTQVDFSESEMRDSNKRSYLCRHVDGVLSKDDLKEVIMRIPRNLMKDILLSKKESIGKSQFVFRGFAIE